MPRPYRVVTTPWAIVAGAIDGLIVGIYCVVMATAVIASWKLMFGLATYTYWIVVLWAVFEK